MTTSVITIWLLTIINLAGGVLVVEHADEKSCLAMQQEVLELNKPLVLAGNVYHSIMTSCSQVRKPVYKA